MNFFLWEALLILNDTPDFNQKKIGKNIFFVHKETLCYFNPIFKK